MAIDKVTGVAWTDLSKISGVAKADIAKVAGQDAPSSGLVTTDLVFHIDPADSSSYPGSGSTIYDLVGSTNGSFQGGTYVDSNGHLILDGANDCINFGTISTSVPAALYNTSWSISAWCNNDDSGESFQYFWSQWTSGGSNRFDFFRSTGTDSLAFRVDVSSSAIQVGASGQFPSSSWQYVTANFNDSTNTISLYRNTSFLTSGTSQNTANVSKSFRIGSNGSSAGSNEWRGKLGAFHVYDRELSASEITQNYNATKATYGL